MNTTLVSSPFGSSSVQIGRTSIECGACAPNTNAIARFAETVAQRPPAVSRSGHACLWSTIVPQPESAPRVLERP